METASREIDPTESNVVVSGGVVHFWGTVRSEEERTALRVVAETSAASRIIRSRDRAMWRHSSRRFEAAGREPFPPGNGR
jgi:hypothetical protein